MRARRRALPPDARARQSRLVCARILGLTCKGSDPLCVAEPGKAIVAVYLASPDEIDLMPAIRAMRERGATVVAPRWDGETYRLARFTPDRLRRGPMGILEPADADPVAPRDVRLWLVPGLAFTRDGARLGYGGGWYDRLLAEAAPDALKLGVAYGFQIVDALPSEPHDIRLDGVVTD